MGKVLIVSKLEDIGGEALIPASSGGIDAFSNLLIIVVKIEELIRDIENGTN